MILCIPISIYYRMIKIIISYFFSRISTTTKGGIATKKDVVCIGWEVVVVTIIVGVHEVIASFYL